MIHPDTEIRRCSSHVGYGVFATAFIPRGTLTFVKDPLDIELTPADIEQLGSASRQQVEKYSYMEPSGNMVLSWDIAKYVNHSCDPNTLSTGWGFEIAVRDIWPDEEITDDYGLFNMAAPMDCCCETAGCRKQVRPADIDDFVDDWDHRLQPILSDIPFVFQPLFPFLSDPVRNEIERVLEHRHLYRSVSWLRRRPTMRALASR